MGLFCGNECVGLRDLCIKDIAGTALFLTQIYFGFWDALFHIWHRFAYEVRIFKVICVKLIITSII